MAQSPQDTIATLITHYGLELDGSQVDTVISTWLEIYDPTWIVKAIVSSVYEGRYKVRSVDSILKNWQRTGQLRHRFPPEYERGILQKLVEIEKAETNPLTEQVKSLDHRTYPSTYQPTVPANLNPEESAPFQHHPTGLYGGDLLFGNVVNESVDSNIECNSPAPALPQPTRTTPTSPAEAAVNHEQPNRAMWLHTSARPAHQSVTLPPTSQLINTLTVIIEQNQAEEDTELEPLPLPFPQHLQ